MSLPTDQPTAECPPVPDDGQRTEAHHGPVANEDRLRILLADDSAVARVFAARLLEFSGHDVDIVTDGQQAVDAARHSAYDVILMDVHMPEMDGVEATVTLRAGGYTLPILALSGTAAPEDFEDCLDAGMNGSLAKPFTIKAFETECHRIRKPSDEC